MFQDLSLSAFCPVVDLCVCSYLQQEEASLMKAEKILIYEYRRKPLEIILFQCSLSRTVVFDFFPWVHVKSSFRFWAIQEVSGMNSIYGRNLNSNQIALCYSHKFCATITAANLAGSSPLWTTGFVAGIVIFISPLEAYRISSRSMNTDL